MGSRNICSVKDRTLAILKHFKEITPESIWSDKGDRKANDAINTGKDYCAVSFGFPIGVYIHSCLLIDCELRTEIRFGFAFKAVLLFEVLSYENSISVSVLNLVSSLSRYK